MARMRAAVLVEPGRFELADRPVPSPQPYEVLVKVERAGICGTDLHIFHGHYAADSLPLVPGHEFVGTIAARGSSVKHLSEGQRVVVDINVGCGTCFWCRRNEILSCPDMHQIGISGDGAFADYLAVPARLVLPVPPHVKPEVAALTEPVACVVRAAKKARIGLGQSAVVLGAGPIGNLHIQLLRLLGAAPIVAFELSGLRCDMAKEAGADAVVSDPARLQETVLEMTSGRGADVVIESVGSPGLYAEAFRLIRRGGHVAFFGIPAAGAAVPVDILQTILREDSLKGSVAGMGEDMHDALTLLSHGRFRTERFTASAYALADIQQAFDSVPQRPHHLKTQIVF